MPSRLYRLQLAQHIHYGLRPLPFETLRPKGAMSYMLETLSEIERKTCLEKYLNVLF